MIKFDRSEIKEKFNNMLQKDITNIPRAIRNMILRQEKSIDIYILNLTDNFSSHDVQIADSERFLAQKSVVIEILSRESLTYFEEYLELRKDILTRKFLEDILKNGCICFLALVDNNVIGAVCLAFKEFPLFGFDLDFVFTKDQAYFFHSFVKENFRKKGIATLLKLKMIDFCRAKGLKYLVSAIYEDNKVSRHLSAKVGFKKYTGVIVVNQFFMKRHIFQSDKSVTGGILTVKTFGKALVRI